MIPLRLRVSGFLSYREPVELDFTTFDLACISGPNGAGKSTLLDAMTWALFGQARKRDESLINLQSKAAEVALTFGYEGAIYRVQRSITRGKATALEFQIQRGRPAPASSSSEAGSLEWSPLTERKVSDTQDRIESILRLDYDTFVNASFFLQGKADQFAQQTPARRKEVLANILGLESWEEYHSRAAAERRRLEGEISTIEGRRAEIAAELAEENPRRERLSALEADFQRLDSIRASQEKAVESTRRIVAALQQQRETVGLLRSALERSRTQLIAVKTRLAERESVHSREAELLGRADEVRLRYASWQQARDSLERWSTIASAFHEQEQGRLPYLQTIATEKARLEQELAGLRNEHGEIERQAEAAKDLEARLAHLQAEVVDLDLRVLDRAETQSNLNLRREAQARMQAENEALRPEMESLRSRIEALQTVEGATCPLCGQPLNASHREATLAALQAEGKQRGDLYRANSAALKDVLGGISALEEKLGASSEVENERLAMGAEAAKVSERLERLRAVRDSWMSTGSRRLAELREMLDSGLYGLPAREALRAMDTELTRIGYDAAAHDAARELEFRLRSADDDYRSLQAAAAGLAPLKDEIAHLQLEVGARTAEISSQEQELQRAETTLESTAHATADLEAAEHALLELRERQNVLNREIGAARQKVVVLNDLRSRDAEYAAGRQDLALRAGRYRVLERALGKDGVPALLIEQALPEIESKANELLDRLSDGRMSVRFITQAGYKDRKRADLKETLDIQVSDGAGVRDYELYSGGEAFRINFAVRLALSEVLAARKGARLQTLVIDEGFASQDDQGRQRLIEAINLVKNDFALVLVITHLEQLKDAFPTRIEIEKTETGSRARII